MKEGITILLVEVYAPAYDQSYDMRVEEQTSIRQLMEEMAVLIGQKEKNIMPSQARDMSYPQRDNHSGVVFTHIFRCYSSSRGSDIIVCGKPFRLCGKSAALLGENKRISHALFDSTAGNTAGAGQNNRVYNGISFTKRETL